MSERTELFYTFGNHHHWVDMEWLWGYDVMSGDIEDMLTFCRETGAKGNVNWEAGGFEKIASEQPEAFAQLRQAIKERTVEVIGGSYGQPYGLFQGDESNIRQMIYGVRTNLRLFGVRPRSFWEEEFYFFPQLPQILRGVGYRYASLFFQWTWHTPEVPYEDSPAIWWEGQDGSRLKTVSRNRMNVHQWPEDIDTVLNEIQNARQRAGSGEPATLTPHLQNSITPVLLQWLELMPTKDWMCRSEVLLPKTRELLSDPRFRFRFGTLSDYLSSLPDELPIRRYGMDEVFHGMSLGKNGDGFRRLSRKAESSLLTAEGLCSLAGLLGRPYPQWDVYPTWELEEGWRELLMAQHHDNDECEGLCGHVGKFSYERSLSLSGHVRESAMNLLARRVDASSGSLLVYNPLPWQRNALVQDPHNHRWLVAKDLPPMGTRAYDQLDAQPGYWKLSETGAVGRCGEVEVMVGADGMVHQIRNARWPEGALGGTPLLRFEVTEAGHTVVLEYESMEIDSLAQDLVVRFRHPIQGGLRVDLRLSEGCDGLDVTLTAASMPRPDPGMQTGMTMTFQTACKDQKVVADQPLGQQEVRADGTYRKKYPTGDWMTSPQRFEEVCRPFTGNTFVDLSCGSCGKGLLVAFDRTRQWFLDGDAYRCLLTMYDPWDEDYYIGRFSAQFRLIPHSGLTNSQRYRLAQELNRPCERVTMGESRRDTPAVLAGPSVDQQNVTILAFYREMESSGRECENYGGLGMEYPYVLRLLELDGIETTVSVRLPGTPTSVVRTNLLGEPEDDCTLEVNEVRLTIGPYRIATLYLDLVEGRKQVRDLDAHRNVWAQIHREV